MIPNDKPKWIHHTSRNTSAGDDLGTERIEECDICAAWRRERQSLDEVSGGAGVIRVQVDVVGCWSDAA